MGKIKKGAGFTLIELLVVIAIIGFLATAGFVAYNTVKQKGRDARRKANISTITKALGLYYTRNEKYPPSAGGSCLTAKSDDTVSQDLKQDLPQMPSDIIAPATTISAAAGGPHCYFYTSNESSYTLQYFLEGEGGTKIERD